MTPCYLHAPDHATRVPQTFEIKRSKLRAVVGSGSMTPCYLHAIRPRNQIRQTFEIYQTFSKSESASGLRALFRHPIRGPCYYQEIGCDFRVGILLANRFGVLISRFDQINARKRSNLQDSSVFSATRESTRRDNQPTNQSAAKLLKLF